MNYFVMGFAFTMGVTAALSLTLLCFVVIYALDKLETPTKDKP